MSDTTEIELILDQTLSALKEISEAISNRPEPDKSIANALKEVTQALLKKQPLDVALLMRELVSLSSKSTIQVLPAPIQFLPCPDVFYELETHPTVNGKQRVTIKKSSKQPG